MIKTKRFNKNILSKTLQPYCHSRLSNSYLSTMNNTAKSCFQNLKHHLTNDFDANYAMSACCFECLSNLSAISYTKIFILQIFREILSLLSGLFRYFIDKNLIRYQKKKHACFCFWS